MPLKEKAEALNRKRTKALKEKESLTLSIVYYGLCRSGNKNPLLTYE